MSTVIDKVCQSTANRSLYNRVQHSIYYQILLTRITNPAHSKKRRNSKKKNIYIIQNWFGLEKFNGFKRKLLVFYSLQKLQSIKTI